MENIALGAGGGGDSLQQDAKTNIKKPSKIHLCVVATICLLPLNPYYSVSDHFLGSSAS